VDEVPASKPSIAVLKRSSASAVMRQGVLSLHQLLQKCCQCCITCLM
jgi:hypothetical protein